MAAVASAATGSPNSTAMLHTLKMTQSPQTENTERSAGLKR